ncbi:hypothetical protein D3C81_1370120 [compost metagenome]
MGDALLELGGGGVLGIQVHRVAVAGNLGEQLDVAFRHSALVGGFLTDLQFIVGGVFYQTHALS